MKPVLSSQDLGRLRQAMLLGLARQPLVVPEPLKPVVAALSPDREPALAVLALAGQQRRFQRPIVERGSAEAVPGAARALHADERPILPDNARRPLLRLIRAVGKGTSAMVDAVPLTVRRVTAAGMRPHPFDLPLLIPHIRKDAACLGLAERAYLALAGGADEALGLPHADITAENWAAFPLVHRVAFLRELRRIDPSAARGLLEAADSAEPAAVRGELLSALEIGLGPEDLRTLEAAAKDRAESVRTIAARLINLVPGTSPYAARLSDAARCFAREASTMSRLLTAVGLGSRPKVAFREPDVLAKDRFTKVTGLFDGLSARAIGATAGIDAADVIGAIPGNDFVIPRILLASALRDRDWQTLVHMADIYLQGEPYQARMFFQNLASNWSGPTPPELGDPLLAFMARRRSELLDQKAANPSPAVGDDDVTATAALLPAGRFPEFLAVIDPLPATITRKARDIAEVALALEPVANGRKVSS